MHNEGELLKELRCYLLAFNLTKIGKVKRLEPVHKPKLDHEETIDPLYHLTIKLLLRTRAQAIHSSHLGKLKAILHVLKWALEERIESCEHNHESTVLTSSDGDIIPELPPRASHDFSILV